MTQQILLPQHDRDTGSVISTAASGSSVSTDEFTAAINRIEARRAKESAQANGTVDIEQTIRELHIDASSEEVRREVAALRAEAEEVRHKAQHASQERLQAKRIHRKAIGWRTLGGFTLVMLGAGGQLITDYHNGHHGASGGAIPSATMTVANLSNGQEMFMSSTQLESLIGAGANLTNTIVAEAKGTASSGTDSVWPAVRSGDTLYAYGYADAGAVHQGLSTQQLTATEGDGTTVVAVPLPGVVALSVAADTPLSPDSITLTNVPSHLTASPK